jgi:tetratricopeptide (TPR) repeat protein
VSRRGLRTLVGACAVAAFAVPLSAAIDPFYSSRLQEGIVAAERGANADAVRSLRIACFGMLDDAPQLADCLVRLALAQAAGNDQEGFSQTFRRLVEGEELVGLYSKAGLPPDLTGRFEAKVVEWIPRAALAGASGFQRLAADQRESQLAALQPKARRERLAKLEKDEPKVARWPLLLARLEKEQGNAKAALAAAERALQLAPDLAEARCLRGWGRAGTGKHAEALTDLAGCRGGDPAFAVAELQSRVALQQWSEASALLASLTPEQRKLPGVGDLEKKIGAATKQAAAPRPTPVAAEEAQQTGTPPAVGDRTSGAAHQPQPAPTGNAHQDSGRVNRDGAPAAVARPTPTPTPVRDTAAAMPPPAAPAPATPPRSAPTPAPTPVPAATTRIAAAAPTPSPTATPAATTRTVAASAPPLPAGPPGGALAPADETALGRAQAMLSRARTPAEIEAAYAVAADLAARYPNHQRVQHTAAEIAYRASRWSDAVRHFRRGGDPGEAQPLLLFYYAVSLWESGARGEAAAVMRRCDGKVRPTPFVQAYRDKILGAGSS